MGSDGAGIDGGNELLREKIHQVPQGISADLIATLEGFSREELDRFALSSQRKAEQARKEGRFRKSLVPVRDPRSSEIVLAEDEHPRPDTTLEGLATLAPAFVEMGAKLDGIALAAYPEVESIRHVHTAGNSSGIVDGAAAVLLASEDYVQAHGLSPRGRILATATYGAEPVIMLTAPAPASERALKKAKMAPGDIDLWEINEAFAAIPLQTIRKLGIEPDRVNVNGGAIALGHPLGATGAILLGTALDELERRNQSTALVTLCIGGGMGVAAIVERI
jgi:acetyl-CoA C-acetyltransferase